MTGSLPAAPAPVPAAVAAVLAEYRIGPALAVRPAGGTAGRTWQVGTARGAFFLRLRGSRTSSEQRLQFDHGLRDHLLARGVPTAAALWTRGGQRWQRRPEGVFELYPFVAGAAFAPDRIAQVEAAGRALARYHRAAAAYRPAGAPERVAQYGALGLGVATSDRLDDPALLEAALRATAPLAPDAAAGAVVGRCLARLDRLRDEYGGQAYAAVCGWVIHGDYTPANLLYAADDRIAGIFDLDWALPGARCRDVADGLFFFGSVPRRIDPGSIWSLTEAASFDPGRCAAFLRAYAAESGLAEAEARAVPAAFAGRWLSIRLEGMAKVPAGDRFRFFARQVEEPMAWLEAHWEGLRRWL